MRLVSSGLVVCLGWVSLGDFCCLLQVLMIVSWGGIVVFGFGICIILWFKWVDYCFGVGLLYRLGRLQLYIPCWDSSHLCYVGQDRYGLKFPFVRVKLHVV